MSQNFPQNFWVLNMSSKNIFMFCRLHQTFLSQILHVGNICLQTCSILLIWPRFIFHVGIQDSPYIRSIWVLGCLVGSQDPRLGSLASSVPIVPQHRAGSRESRVSDPKQLKLHCENHHPLLSRVEQHPMEKGSTYKPHNQNIFLGGGKFQVFLEFSPRKTLGKMIPNLTVV